MLLAVALALAANMAGAETIGGNPGPQYNYVCPNSDGKPPLDCYFDAVGHLYTMCKHVKSIEILEFGYEKSTDGTNGAKSESCVVKQKLNMTRPYQAALKSATRSAKAIDGLRALNEKWLKALTDLAWRPGESDTAYKARTMEPYESFAASIVNIQTSIQLAQTATGKKTAAAKPKAPQQAAQKAAH
ncbi:MAG TPA: hypothetical protein VIH36_07180 [Casimicrobiaceae bacterium]|jgi:hypothetical protein